MSSVTYAYGKALGHSIDCNIQPVRVPTEFKKHMIPALNKSQASQLQHPSVIPAPRMHSSGKCT